MAGDDHSNAEVHDGGRKKRKRPREMKMIDVRKCDFEEDNKCCCRECGKRFGSPKALYGHMRCHPERWWRGINPPSLPLYDQAVVEKRDGYIHIGGGGVAAGYDDDQEVAECLLMLSNGRNVVSSKTCDSLVSARCGILDLNIPAPGEHLPYSVCSSSSLNLELGLSFS